MRIERPSKRHFIDPKKADELNDRICYHARQFSDGEEGVGHSGVGVIVRPTQVPDIGINRAPLGIIPNHYYANHRKGPPKISGPKIPQGECRGNCRREHGCRDPRLCQGLRRAPQVEQKASASGPAEHESQNNRQKVKMEGLRVPDPQLA